MNEIAIPQGVKMMAPPKYSPTGLTGDGSAQITPAKDSGMTAQDYIDLLRKKIPHDAPGGSPEEGLHQVDPEGWTGQPQPGKTYQSELAKWNTKDPSIDPFFAQKFLSYNDYFKQGQFAPGSPDANVDVAKQAEIQWSHDRQPGGFERFMPAIAGIGLAFTGAGSALAASVGHVGAGAAMGATTGLISGGDPIKGALLGAVGGGFAQFASGFEGVGKDLVTAGGKVATSALSGNKNPLTAGLLSGINSSVTKATDSPGLGTLASAGTGLILNNQDQPGAVQKAPAVSAPKVDIPGVQDSLLPPETSSGFAYAIPGLFNYSPMKTKAA